MKDVKSNLLLHAPCGIMSFTEEGIITSANAYCHKILQYNQTELAGNNIAILLTISGRIFYQTHFYPLVKLHQHAEEIFFNFQSKLKKDVPVVMNASIIRENDVTEILCSFIPVLNRRKYEDEILLAKKTAEEALLKNEILEKVKQELEAQQTVSNKQITLLKFQNKELLQLSDIITHDMQEPVRKLLIFSNELQQAGGDAILKDRALSVINNSSQKIKILLNNLQDYLALTEPVLLKDKVDLDKLIDEELKQLQEAYPGVQLTATRDSLPTITGNKNQLALLIHHIFKNAFDHGTNNADLTLQVQAVILKENILSALGDNYLYVDYLKITIKDNGPGFNGRFNDYIFGALKKLNIAKETPGFGLAFCKRIVENHSGSIKAEGITGRGAKFIILLPVDIS